MATEMWSCSCCPEAFTCWLRFKLTPEEIEQRMKSREIDRVIEKDKQTYKRQVKLLLLGAGESGKSTFLKQMRIIHGVQFEPELIKEYQHVIYQNIVRGMQVLIDARDKLNIKWECPSNQVPSDQVRTFLTGHSLDMKLFQEYSRPIEMLWQDKAIKQAYDRRREFQLVSVSKSHIYFSNINITLSECILICATLYCKTLVINDARVL